VTRLVWRRRVPWGLGVLATGGSSSSGSSSRRVRSTALFFQVRLRVALFAWVLVYGGLAFLPATREALVGAVEFRGVACLYGEGFSEGGLKA